MYKMKKLNLERKEFNSKGITLVALVVTIVILLILAGITIASLTGDNGLIGKSGEAKNATEKSQEKEELEVAVIRFTDKRGNLDATKIVNGLQNDIKNLKEVTNTDGKFPVKVEYKNGHKYGITRDGDILENLIGPGDTAPDDSNAVYMSGSYIAVIPSGFTVSSTESTIGNGLVITDQNDNEWVWIPTSSEDLAKMYESGSIEYTMSGTSITTTYKSIKTTLENRVLSRGNPGTTSTREPDILSSGDNNNANCNAAGFGSKSDMATNLRDDYKDMIESIKNNKGFYIGRYEIGGSISEPIVQKNKAVITNQNWHNLYKACKSFSGKNIESRMIWGCQWDQVCRFISTFGDNKVNSLDNSTKYGNYSNSDNPANVTGAGSKQLTGYSEYWKTNNIYDLAGNCQEWTQEATGGTNRIVRGRMLCGRWYSLFCVIFGCWGCNGS